MDMGNSSTRNNDLASGANRGNITDSLVSIQRIPTDMTSAKDPAQYNQAWQWHIDQLASLALAAGVQYNDYTSVKKTLEAWLTVATEKFETSQEHHNG